MVTSCLHYKYETDSLCEEVTAATCENYMKCINTISYQSAEIYGVIH